MPRFLWLAIATVALGTAAHAMTPEPCAVELAIDRQGSVLFYANGWFRSSATTLHTIMGAGMYPKECPVDHPITSVTLDLLPHAPQTRIDYVYSLLRNHGWSRDKIVVQYIDTLPRRDWQPNPAPR